MKIIPFKNKEKTLGDLPPFTIVKDPSSSDLVKYFRNGDDQIFIFNKYYGFYMASDTDWICKAFRRNIDPKDIIGTLSYDD